MLAKCLSGLGFGRTQPEYIQRVTELAGAGIQPARDTGGIKRFNDGPPYYCDARAIHRAPTPAQSTCGRGDRQRRLPRIGDVVSGFALA
jgi:hypothetical protein